MRDRKNWMSSGHVLGDVELVDESVGVLFEDPEGSSALSRTFGGAGWGENITFIHFLSHLNESPARGEVRFGMLGVKTSFHD